MRTLDRYIVKELIPFFLMGISAAVLIFIAVNLVDYIDKIFNRWPWRDVLWLVTYDVPKIIVQSLPVAFLFGTLLALGRMGQASEITAMRAGGVSFTRIVLPILALSLAVSGASFLLNDRVVPWANNSRGATVQAVMKGFGRPLQSPEKYFKGLDRRFFFVERADRAQNTMSNVVIYDQRRTPPVVITATGGNWIGSTWNLSGVVIHEYEKDGFVKSETPQLTYRTDVRLDLSRVLAEQEDPQNLTRAELLERMRLLKEGGLEAKVLEVEYHYRFAIPFATFFAALIAAPLGLMFARYGSYIGGGIALILIFFYFVILSIGKPVGEFALAPAWIATWSQNFMFGLIGLVLLNRVDS